MMYIIVNTESELLFIIVSSVFLCFCYVVQYFMGFPGGSDAEESACSAGDLGSSLGQEDSLEMGLNPFQYSCLENPMYRRAPQATVRGVAKSQT